MVLDCMVLLVLVSLVLLVVVLVLMPKEMHDDNNDINLVAVLSVALFACQQVKAVGQQMLLLSFAFSCMYYL